MEKIAKYRQIITSFMQEQADIRKDREQVQTQFVKDEEGRHYQLVNVGFQKGIRIYGCFIHIDIKADGKVWIQHDGTDLEVADILNEMGIPKDDIVLGFYEEKLRQYTDFAIA